MAKLALRYGHGSNTYEDKRSKGVVVGGKVYEEHTFNATVGVKVKKIVEAHGVTVLEIQPPMGLDVPLDTGIKKANDWKADLFWSIHANAAQPEAKGMCAFYWSTSAGGQRAAEAYSKLCKEYGLTLYHGGLWGSVAGTWNAFRELEKTDMVAVLTENKFMTNPHEFKEIFLNENNFHNICAYVNARAILEYFKIPYDPYKSGEKKKEVVSAVAEDISKHWAVSALKKAEAQGILTRDKDGNLNPDKELTRAQLATILERLGLI
jgi:N-acetylmuramoyl-L-alanine amidase